MIKVSQIKALSDFQLELTFSDGMTGRWDAKSLLARDGSMVQPLRDPDYFARVFLEAGAPTWPNGFDLAPWALRSEIIAVQSAPSL